jgi:hypothetical protein
MPSNAPQLHDEVQPATSAAWIPKTDEEREAIREQLGRIVASTLFRNSKRFPSFLKFTVEHALTSAGALKERTIGHEVFGRDPGYDTAQDPVVRMTANEVRKRLTQYYQGPEHIDEPVIAFQLGSYVPVFYAPVERQTSSGPDAPEQYAAIPRRVPRWSLPVVLAIAALLSILTIIFWRPTRPAADAASRFWAPIVRSVSPVLICIGDIVRFDPQTSPEDQPGEITIEQFLRTNGVRYTDAVTLGILTAELRTRGKPFRIRRPAAIELKDLRDGPVLLIGGFNNPWALRLSTGLRFQLASDPVSGSYIRDREHPDRRDWTTGDRSRPLKTLEHTYGLITRVADPATGHSVLTVSGLALGTRAAGECLVDAECLTSTERLGANWDHRNIQIVVAAAVIGEDSGAPRVVAVHSW